MFGQARCLSHNGSRLILVHESFEITIYILTLKSLQTVTKTILQNIIDNLKFTPSTLDDLYQEINSLIGLKRSEFETASQRAEQILEESEKANIKIITVSDAKFPQQLHTIKNPPLVLYIKGEIECLHSERLIAIIGTRTPSEKGRKAGSRISKKFTEWGWNIVSGLALGCDTVAHEGCLEVQGQTIAFLAHGLHKIYPSANSNLAERIIDAGGCLVSEYPLGQEGFKNQFVERDRLQSGLSSAVIVVETDVKGGTMHTVNFCLEQKKPLACLNYAGDYSYKSRYGNKKLINEGKAVPLWEPETIENFEKLVISKFTKNSNLTKVDIEIKQTELFDTQQIVETEQVETTVHNHQHEVVKIETSVNKEEYEQFQEKSSKNGHSPEQMLQQLIQQFLSSESPKKQDLTLKFEENQQEIPSPETKSIPKDPLNQKDLAARLGVQPTTIKTHKDKGDLPKWSISKDPDKLSWQYSEETKQYVVIN